MSEKSAVLLQMSALQPVWTRNTTVFYISVDLDMEVVAFLNVDQSVVMFYIIQGLNPLPSFLKSALLCW